MTDKSPTLTEQLAAFGRPRFTPYDEETGKGLEVQEPVYSRVIEDGEYVAPTARAENEYGVIFRADHETLADGMCRQARTHAAMLNRHIPVLLQSISCRVRRPVFDEETGKQIAIESFSLAGDDMLEQEVFDEVGQLRRTRIRNYLGAVYNTVIHSASGLRGLILPEYTRAIIGAAEKILGRSVVYTPWERSTVGPDIVELLTDLGQVWLQCTRNMKVFEAAGVPASKLRLVWPAYDPAGPVALIPNDPAVPKGLRFYNIGKWEPRKAQHELIGAFLRTFKPFEATLTMKTSLFGRWTGYPSHKETLPLWLEDAAVRRKGWTPARVERFVKIYDTQFTTEQMTALHRLHNIYVSTSHAEGWDYPAFDAKTAGNRLVYVPYGGAEDYADETDYPIPYELGPVHPEYAWEQNAEWAHCSLDTISAVLRAAAAPERREFRGDLAARFGADSIGRVMSDALAELVRMTEPGLVEKAWRPRP